MIGIITFHFAYNYGACLQAYALKTYINQNIGNCKILNYIPEKIYSNYHIGFKDVIKKPRLLVPKIRRIRQDILFDSFISNILGNSLVGGDIKTESSVFEFLITGSDQVWNTELTKNDLNYFLSFADSKQKRVSYGASVGNSQIVSGYSNEVLEEIRKFNYLSCREKSAIQALKLCLGENLAMENVVDPTLLLTRQEWMRLSKKPNGRIPDRYILYYALTESEELKFKTEEISKEFSYPILSIHPLAKRWSINGKNMNNVGPLEFVWLISNASYVCTNSFHGSVFSVIFRKKCILGAHSKLGERNRQLLDWMNLDKQSFGEIIDFSLCDYSKINNEISNSKDFLKKALYKEN